MTHQTSDLACMYHKCNSITDAFIEKGGPSVKKKGKGIIIIMMVMMMMIIMIIIIIIPYWNKSDQLICIVTWESLLGTLRLGRLGRYLLSLRYFRHEPERLRLRYLTLPKVPYSVP